MKFESAMDKLFSKEGLVHATGPNEYQLMFQADAGKPNIHALAIPHMEVEQTAIVTISIK